MPKLKSRPPKLGKDNGVAVVYAGGRKISLGCKFGTEEAQQAYYRFLAEWGALGGVADQHKGRPCLVDELALRFLDWSKDYRGESSSDHRNYIRAINTMLGVYAGTSVVDFGPKALTVVQDRFVKLDYARKYCNKLTGFIRAVFSWGVAQEIVPAPIADALDYVQPLRKGKTTAPEREPRTPVPIEVVNATLPYLLPTIADMVRLQLLAVMRPSDVFRMKVGDIDKSQEIWVYRPGYHKGTWREHHRAVALGESEQAILTKRMAGKEPGQYVFTPKEAMQERCERDAAKRKSKVSPSQQKRKEKCAKKPKRKYLDCYNANSYRRSIARAIEAANEKLPDDKKISHWYPYKIRHTGVTELVKTEGLDVARAVAGQRSVNVTQIYNHSDEAKAVEVAKRRTNPLQ